MARIRTIKPEFWTDEKIMESSPMARLLLIGVLNFADDRGNIEAGSLSIKAKIFPNDDVDVGPLLKELEANQLLIPYSVNGENYYNIRGFLKHQKIDNPSKPRCPLYDHSETTPRPLIEDSTLEGKGSSKGSITPPTPPLKVGEDFSKPKKAEPRILSNPDEQILQLAADFENNNTPLKNLLARAEDMLQYQMTPDRRKSLQDILDDIAEKEAG